MHGCFWHRHDGCRFSTIPKTRTEFWTAKFAGNVERDSKVQKALLGEGWRVGIVWECALRKPQDVDAAAIRLAHWLEGRAASFELGSGDC